MAISQSRSRRKVSGGRYRPYRKKRLHELGSEPTLTKIGERKIKQVRVRGGNIKFRVLLDEYVNVALPDGTCKKVKIIRVKENPANRNYVIRNIITKGCIVETELGDVIITSRPGQESTINGKLIKDANP